FLLDGCGKARIGSGVPASPRTFPRTLVRDLLGLVRLLYRAEQDVDMPESYGRLGRLEEAGRALREALELAKRKPVPASAWGWAKKGARIVAEVVQGQPELENLVRLSAGAFRR